MDWKRDKEGPSGEFVLALEGTSTKTRNLALLKRIPNSLALMKEASREFHPIRKSIYLDRKQKAPTEDDIYVCECLRSADATPAQLNDPELSFDCKEKCINRHICTECEAKSCPCGDLCNNRQFQLQQDRCVYPFKAGGKGWGLRAGEFIPAGSFIIQYLGEIFSIKSHEGQRRLAKFANATCTYLMRISAKEVIDPSTKGNIARFINHSCDPNCITQKWNVLGEVAVGIFATKDIEPNMELTFDYKFDVYKTPFLSCLCGAVNCKGYLGLLEPAPEQNQEENENQSESTCEFCRRVIENQDELLSCDSCSKEFHIECLKIAEVPKGRWFCADCVKDKSTKPLSPANPADTFSIKMSESYAPATKETLRSRRKTFLKETADSIAAYFYKELEKSEIPAFFKKQSFLDDLNKQEDLQTIKVLLSQVELHVFKDYVPRLKTVTKMRVFWDMSDCANRNFFLKDIELTVIGTKTQTDLALRVIKLIEACARRLKDNAGFTENSFRIPAIFLKRLLGEYNQNLKNLERDFSVKINYNKTHTTDECYPIHFLSLITIKGKPENVKNAHSLIRDKMRMLIAKRRYLARSDIRIILNKMANIKRDIAPTEIRCCRDNALRDINHPFYTIYYKDKECVIIGTKEEVAKADRYIAKLVEQGRQKDENILSLNYLIPVCNKNTLVNIKNQLEKKFMGAKMIIYDPLHPRKNVSLTLSTSYRYYDKYLDETRHTLDRTNLYRGSFDEYQKQMLYQMSKYFFKYLQNFKQTNSMVFMKSWDTITAEFDESSPYFVSAYTILQEKLKQDYEFNFYIIRVNSLYRLDRMAKLKLSRREYLSILCKTLVRKNERSLTKEFSIFTDPSTGRLPSDYSTLINQMNYSPSEEDLRYPRAKAAMKEIDLPRSSDSESNAKLRPHPSQKILPRPRRGLYSSSPEYSVHDRKSPEPMRYVPMIQRRFRSHVRPSGKSLSSFSASDKPKGEKANKDSFSSRDISIHYRDQHRQVRPQLRYDSEVPRLFPEPKRRVGRSPSVNDSSSSISAGSVSSAQYARYNSGFTRGRYEQINRDYERKSRPPKRNYPRTGFFDRYDAYPKSGAKRSK